jgi:tripartite ATP-independent transporter DctP family solute receptor
MNTTLRKIIVTVSLSMIASSAFAEPIILKYGHVGKPGSLFEASVEEFAKRANAKLGDKAEVQVFGSSQLGKDKELLQKLKLGQITFSLPSSVMSSVADEFGVFEMPYIIKDREHMKRVQGAIGESVLQKAVNNKGYQILAYWENGFRNITNNTRPINTPEDLKGVKLRTPKGAWRVKMFKLYGANPTPMAFSEVFTALKTNVIDGQENPYAQIWSAKFQEVQKYLSITGHVYTPAYVLVSKEHFAKLPEDVQKILMETAQETQAFVYDLAAQLEVDLLQNLKDGGITVNTADKDAFIAASKPIYDEFSTSIEGGAELINTVQGLAN